MFRRGYELAGGCEQLRGGLRVPVPPGMGSPIMCDNRLVFSADVPGQPKLICLDPATGKALWERTVPPARTTPRSKWNSAGFVRGHR